MKDSNLKFVDKEKRKSCWLESVMSVVFDLERGQEIEQQFPENVEFDKDFLHDITYLAFPDSNSSQFTNQTSKECITYYVRVKEKNKGYFFGHVFFQQEPDCKIHRGYSMKSIILLTKYPFLDFFQRVVKIVGNYYFSRKETKSKFQLSQIFEEIKDWPIPKVDTLYTLKFFGTSIKYRTPLFEFCRKTFKAKQYRVNRKTGQVRNGKSIDPLKARLQGRRWMFQGEVNLFKLFRNHLQSLYKFWELVILGEPILVMSPDPKRCSEAVIGLISLIAPIPFEAEYRPYFTVHNVEYEHYIKMGDSQGLSSIICGVTNPFFIKSYEGWPHILAIGTDSSNKNNQSHSPSSPFDAVRNFVTNFTRDKKSSGSDFRKKLLWNYEESFFSTRNFVIKSSDSLRKNLLMQNESDMSKSAYRLNNAHIGRYFETVTQAFLYPLQKCFERIVYNMKTFIVKHDHKTIFKPEKFVNFVQKHGYRSEIFQGSDEEIIAMYIKFIYSRNFSSWLDRKILEFYYHELRTTDITSIVKNGSDSNTVDIFMRIVQDITIQKEDPNRDEYVVKKLEGFVSEMILQVPETLKDALCRILESNNIEI